MILRLLRDPAPRPPLGSMPIALADLLEASLAKDPGRRPRSAASFAEALRAIEEAAGWPKTPYVVWEAEELMGGPPALRPASVKGALEAGPGETADGIEDIWDEQDSGRRRREIGVGHGGDGCGGGAGRRRPGRRRCAVDRGHVASGPGRYGRGRRPSGQTGDDQPGDEQTGDEQTGDGELDAGELDDRDASEAQPAEGHAGEHGDEGGDGKGSHGGYVPAGREKRNEPAGTGAGGDGPDATPADMGPPANAPPDREGTLPATRHVIMPPAVERTVVDPQALPPRLADTSQPAHAIQSHRRSTGIPRQAG